MSTIIRTLLELTNLTVTDRKSFAAFLVLLRQNLIDHPEEWENQNLPDFLDALASYTEDIQGYYNNTQQHINADEPSWNTFATIFQGAKVYE